ncbi:g12350 [Coccomyxa viridis]|uniref:G12350 protein n=1 Tax=Coccomyxa viridis TaxID=1274662 RepID=A0ABP1GE88_9CHLO
MAVEDGAPASGKMYSLTEVKQHNTEEDCWIVVHGKVYNVTEFLDEHPGGFDIILTNTGKDATEDFEEIGHSNAAKDLLSKYIIGDFEGGDVSHLNKPSISAVRAQQTTTASNPALKLLQILLPLLVILAAIFVPKYLL